MPDSDPSSCRVLICDDTAGIRMLLRLMLSARPGLTVVGEACNGQEAIDAARELRPDIVLLDISMPVMDGIEALPLIRSASPSTSVVMLSGFSSPEIKQRALEQGAVEYLDKGIDLERVIAAVQLRCKDGNAT